MGGEKAFRLIAQTLARVYADSEGPKRADYAAAAANIIREIVATQQTKCGEPRAMQIQSTLLKLKSSADVKKYISWNARACPGVWTAKFDLILLKKMASETDMAAFSNQLTKNWHYLRDIHQTRLLYGFADKKTVTALENALSETFTLGFNKYHKNGNCESVLKLYSGYEEILTLLAFAKPDIQMRKNLEVVSECKKKMYDARYCEPLGSGSKSANSINLVFFAGDCYEIEKSEKDMVEFKKYANIGVSDILKNQFFSKNKARISFYLSNKKISKDIMFSTDKRYLCSTDISIQLNKGVGCNTGGSGSVEVYTQDLSIIPTQNILALVHELGHAFGLADEYTEKIIRRDEASDRPGYPNCAPNSKTAQLWWGDLVNKGSGELKVGYNDGCSYIQKNVRPTKNSVMKDPKRFKEYGVVNERHMQKVLDRYTS